MSVRYSIVIPAYNEERTITRSILETETYFQKLGEPYEIIVVDDGSHDLTVPVVQRLQDKRLGLSLLRHPSNQGKGKAVQSGVQKAKGDFILFLDADLSTHPTMFDRALPFLNDRTIVIASRNTPKSSVPEPQPWYRVLAGQSFNFFIRHYLHLPFRDTQCGFKIFPKSSKSLFHDLQTSGWAFDVELLLRAQKNGFTIQEIPIEWRNGTESRVRLSDWRSIFHDLRRLKKS